MDIPHFTHPFTGDRYVDCIYFLAVMNIAAVNIQYRFLYGHMFLVLLGLIPRSGSTSSYGNSMSNVFEELPNCFLK